MSFFIISREDKEACKKIVDSVCKLAFSEAFQMLSIWWRKSGWRYSPWQLYEKLQNKFFDYRYGTDTRLDAELSTLQIDSSNKKHGARYHASPVYSFRQIMRRLKIQFTDYTFVDYGSGKGRTLLLASELPFKQVIGVEFSAKLNECAAINISKYPKQLAQQLQIFQGDAAHFELPLDNLVLYFFNPFTDEVLSQVLANISDSLKRKQRNIIIVYLYLENPALLENLKGLQLKEKWHRFHIYQTDDI
jgi:SAM-dependent methyltransferase